MLDTLANVKARLGITGTTNDAFLTQQIQLVSEVIEAYCRRKFLSQDYKQTFYREDYRASKLMELFHFPVTMVDSIERDSVLMDDEEYRLHQPTGRITALDGNVFFHSKETIVEYTAGYAQADLPLPILAVLDSVVGERYNKKISGIDLNFGSDVQRVSIPGSISIDFDYTLSNNDRKSAYGVILGNNVNILDSYRSERAVLGDSNMSYVEELP